jgi:2-keto-4-pentenoate hydratase/2-oxohepta-3-ene-1,7-dioic acid hydratase in catechol pathway
MKLVRFADPNSSNPTWGELEGDMIHATSFSGAEMSSWTRTGQSFAASSVTMLVPANPSKIVCVGRNYAAHAAELGNEVLKEPGLFLKAPNTLTTTGDTVPYPNFSESFHFEGELGLVISKRANKISRDQALEHILGYTCALDLTARDKQKTDLQWFRAKSSDKFLPLGPHLETDIGDVTNVRVQTRVNGTTRQDGSTALMLFPIATVLEYVSQFMTLEPGDVVITGTPEGVGALEVGDQVEVEVSGIGVLRANVGPKA